MAQNANNVYAAEPLASGALYVAKLGTPGPTSATDTLNPAYVSLGHVGEDGFTETTDRSVEKTVWSAGVCRPRLPPSTATPPSVVRTKPARSEAVRSAP